MEGPQRMERSEERRSKDMDKKRTEGEIWEVKTGGKRGKQRAEG